ncbi:AraC-like DNA-binding protein [Actinokineospora baliensis]|uniref:helix-turn-helix domain-containing protein n=1 Tax=Actinokineospora baliensis TaxID=547056 RepID=UPI00195E3A49|nr:helix-turn-helix domain-containing protein [Actinokineospora baliensis]MBM7774719.1 AraC-like DNA-binding protein [Actinokineospora baliensis]
MAYVFDTADLPAPDRVDAVNAALAHASAPCHVILERPDAVAVRIGLWDLGSTNVFTTHANGLRLLRTAKQAKRDAQPVLALSVQGHAPGRHEQFGGQRVIAPGDLMAVDLSAAYDFSWSGPGAAGCLQIPIDHLGLPVDTVRRAIADLRSSPLYPLVTAHITHQVRNADRLAADPAAPALGTANIELVRALVLSAAGRPVRESTVLTQVRAYVRHHLTDHDLTPARIAATHHISVRQLYALCAEAGFSLEQWIIEERLAGAHAELTHTDHTIAATARRWGFRDPTHFTRRFRTRYGQTPHDWRQASQQPPLP